LTVRKKPNAQKAGRINCDECITNWHGEWRDFGDPKEILPIRVGKNLKHRKPERERKIFTRLHKAGFFCEAESRSGNPKIFRSKVWCIFFLLFCTA
jgi:hypothetical protein